MIYTVGLEGSNNSSMKSTALGSPTYFYSYVPGIAQSESNVIVPELIDC